MKLAMLVAAMLAGCATANRHLGRAALVASTAALACDWGQTRSQASAGWIRRRANGEEWSTSERNPILGQHPGTGAVDAYFVTSAFLNLMIWAALPERYRWAGPTAVMIIEAPTVVGNLTTTSNMSTSNSGACGL